LNLASAEYDAVLTSRLSYLVFTESWRKCDKSTYCVTKCWYVTHN